MKVTLCFLAVVGCCLALPFPFEEEALDWENIKGENVYIEPINNYTEDTSVGSRIIGGSVVTPNSVPFQVAIFINGQSFCGGSVISNNFVLTAAHCTIRASFVQLIYGAHNVQTTEATQVRVTSTNIINHNQYVASTLRNDISLVRSPSSITFNNNIRAISLAPASSGTFAGSTGRITGWGRISDSSSGISSTLRGVNVNIITNAVCANTYGTSIIVASTICTSGAGTVGACQGDSGGPLVVNNVQVGVTSFVAAAGCQRGFPSGFARVSSFRSWISQNAGV